MYLRYVCIGTNPECCTHVILVTAIRRIANQSVCLYTTVDLLRILTRSSPGIYCLDVATLYRSWLCSAKQFAGVGLRACFELTINVIRMPFGKRGPCPVIQSGLFKTHETLNNISYDHNTTNVSVFHFSSNRCHF